MKNAKIINCVKKDWKKLFLNKFPYVKLIIRFQMKSFNRVGLIGKIFLLAPGNPIFFNMSTVFLPDGQRTFGNPLSYLGGPILPPRNRSIESVLSLDWSRIIAYFALRNHCERGQEQPIAFPDHERKASNVLSVKSINIIYDKFIKIYHHIN